MKKSILLFIVSVMFVNFTFSQSLTMSKEDGSAVENGDTIILVSTVLNNSFEEVVWVTNSSKSAKYYHAKKTIYKNIVGADNYFCFGECLGTNVFVTEDSVLIASLHTEKGFSAHLDDNNAAGTAIIRYTFFDASNNSDSVSVVIKFISGSGASIDNKVANIIKNIYPNPAINNINIDLNLITSAKSTTIEIFNSMGQKLQSKVLGNISGVQNISMDISNLAEGLYYTRVTIGEKVYSKPFIKK